MNTKLPFQLSAIGLISLFVSQSVYADSPAASTAPEVTLTDTSKVPPNTLLDASGNPLLGHAGDYVVLPAKIPADQVFTSFGPGQFVNVNGSLVYEQGPPVSVDAPALQITVKGAQPYDVPAGTSAADAIAMVQAYLRQNGGTAENTSVLTFVKSAGSDGSITLVDPSTLSGVAGLTVSSAVQSTVQGTTFRDPSPVSASVTGTVVGSTVSGSQGGGLTVGPGNTLTATAVGNNQVLSQTLTAGEQTAAAALLDSTTQQSTTTATLGSSTVGVVAGGAVGGSGITVTGNSAGSTARANDSSASIVAIGSNAGLSGTSQAPNQSKFPTQGAMLNVVGDVIATGYQVVDSGSDVTASTGTTSVGLVLQPQATTSGLTGGVTVQSNNLNTVAGGSRLGLTLSSSLTGGTAGSTAYGLQTAADSNITATASSVTVGVDASATGATVSSVPVAVSANGITTSAIANSANTAVATDLSIASNALAVGSDQGVSASTLPVTVSAQLGNTDVGLKQAASTTGTGVTLSATGNTLATTAIGNQQAETVSLTGGAVNSSAATLINASQGLQAPGGLLNITADTGLISGVVAPATVPSLNSAPVVVGVDNGNLSTKSSVLVSGNTVTAEAQGNTAAQTLSAFSGQVASGLTLAENQNAVATPTPASGSGSSATPATGISISAGLANTALGLGPNVAQAGDTTVTVSNNALESLAQVNQQTQTLGNLTGQVGGAKGGVGVGLSTYQNSDSIYATAGTSGVSLGLAAAPLQLNGASDSVLVSGNSVTAVASVNSATQTLGSISGGVASGDAVTATSSQNVNNSHIPMSPAPLYGANANVSSVGLGFDGTSITLSPTTGATIQADDNTVLASADANQLTRTIGAISGQVGGQVAQYRSGSTQSTSSAGATATVSNIGLGLITSASVTSSAPQLTVDASNNSVQASARENSFSETDAGFSGTLANGGYIGNRLTQSSNSDYAAATVSGVSFGLSGSDPQGNASGAITLSANNNQTRADVAGNLANVALGGASGTLGDGFGYTVSQTIGEESKYATSGGLLFGAQFNSKQSIGQSFPVLSVVDGNLAMTLASGNSSSLSLGGISGSLLAGAVNSTGLSTTQNQDDAIFASAGNTIGNVSAPILIGVGGNANFDGGSTASLPVTVTGNSVLTAAQGNSATSDLGTLNANLASGTNVPNIGVVGTAAVQAQTTQNFGTNYGGVASANTANVDIGLSVNSVAASGAVPVTVSGNTVSTSATANTSTASAAVAGDIGGNVSLSETQTLQYNLGTTSVTANSSAINVGVVAGTLGTNLTAAVSNNVVSAGVAGNSATDSISSLAAAPLTGQVTVGGTQTVTGSRTTLSSLSSTLSNVTVGLSGQEAAGSAPLNVPASIDSNELLATAVANTSTRSVGNVSGVLSGNNTNTPVLALNDAQTVTNALVSASISNSSIGAVLSGSGEPPLNLSVSNNQVIAQAIANSANQELSLDGAVVSSRAMTSLTANQSTVGTTVMASLSGVNVGISPAFTAVGFNGSAVTAGNTVGATAIGNSAQLTHK
jgi:hypothetical protein